MAVGRVIFFLLHLCILSNAIGQLSIVRPKLVKSDRDPSSRIFGGQFARDGQFPYMVFMMFRTPNGDFSRCSGSLVALDKVLLAAHCFNGEQNIQMEKVFLAAGKVNMKNYVKARLHMADSQSVDETALGVQERRAIEVNIMPEFKECSVTCNHDVAIITVNKPFQSSSTVGLLPISQVPITEQTDCVILGWGLEENNDDNIQLNFATHIEAKPLAQCKYKKTGQFYCLQNRNSGICQGDSGSPLVCDGKAYGVASHTLSRSADANCGEDMEEYYAELATALYWLEPLLVSQPSTQHVEGGTANIGKTVAAVIYLPIVLTIIRF